MPKALHRKLEREASAKGLKGRRRDAYVYGTLAKVERKHKTRRRPWSSQNGARSMRRGRR